MGILMHRVYQAEMWDGELFLFCVNAVREYTLREEIAAGQKLIKLDSLELIYETTDRNAARALCDYQEF